MATIKDTRSAEFCDQIESGISDLNTLSDAIDAADLFLTQLVMEEESLVGIDRHTQTKMYGVIHLLRLLSKDIDLRCDQMIELVRGFKNA
ncbi:hypothetical protein [Ferrovibrio sp.]|uniref:hypothetical protein n=1 Tax=Ferrovibrio sp. TaxID=1917215 RepID=UPI0035B20719